VSDELIGDAVAAAKRAEREAIARALALGIADDPAIDGPADYAPDEIAEMWENPDRPAVVSLGRSGPMAAYDAPTRRRLRARRAELIDTDTIPATPAGVASLEPCECGTGPAHLVADHPGARRG
jgi:hypothetical protein